VELVLVTGHQSNGPAAALVRHPHRSPPPEEQEQEEESVGEEPRLSIWIATPRWRMSGGDATGCC
jgi:hypothetical protein